MCEPCHARARPIEGELGGEAPQRGAFLEAPWEALVAALRDARQSAVAQEYDALFHGVGKPEVLLFGSFLQPLTILFSLPLSIGGAIGALLLTGKQLTTPYIKGTVPIITTMMALNGLRIAKIEPVDPFPELTNAYEEPKAAKRPGKLLRGAKITFLTAANKAHELSYFSLDATDKALQAYPDFLDWVGRNKPASALVKSASYLLHDNQFSKTRDMILASADILVQDDTGVPYRYIKQANWNTKLFGKYHRPIKPMEWGYQSDLDKAFKEVKGEPLPFPFGYHWKGQESGLILATRP